jgi:hypothetical protein
MSIPTPPLDRSQETTCDAAVLADLQGRRLDFELALSRRLQQGRDDAKLASRLQTCVDRLDGQNDALCSRMACLQQQLQPCTPHSIPSVEQRLQDDESSLRSYTTLDQEVRQASSTEHQEDLASLHSPELQTLPVPLAWPRPVIIDAHQSAAPHAHQPLSPHPHRPSEAAGHQEFLTSRANEELLAQLRAELARVEQAFTDALDRLSNNVVDAINLALLA